MHHMKNTGHPRRIRLGAACLLFALLLLTLPTAVSCGANDGDGNGNGKGGGSDAGTNAGTDAWTAAPPEFDDICAAVADAVAANDPADYVPREDSYIENFISIVPSDYANCLILVSTEGGSVSEYGVIETSPGEAKKTAEAIGEYFEFYDSIWDDRYIPEEYPKLRDAEVKTFDGRFVVYTILGEDERAAVFEAVGKLFA